MCSITENDPARGGDFSCAQGGCQACQDALVRAHSGLIHTILRRVEHAGLPYAELVQVGRVALWRAVLCFDPGRGVRFTTYGGLAVERALWAAVREARQVRDVPAPLATLPEPWAGISQQPEVRNALRAAVAQLPERLQVVATDCTGWRSSRRARRPR